MDGNDFYYKARTKVNVFLLEQRQITLLHQFLLTFTASGKILFEKQLLLKKGVHFHFTETNYAFFFQVGFLSICTLDLDWKHSYWAHNVKATLYQC